jgi:Trk-type K+ transport system membrane component
MFAGVKCCLTCFIIFVLDVIPYRAFSKRATRPMRHLQARGIPEGRLTLCLLVMITCCLTLFLMEISNVTWHGAAVDTFHSNSTGLKAREEI